MIGYSRARYRARAHAFVPERLRGSTRNRLRNSRVGSSPTECVVAYLEVALGVGNFVFLRGLDVPSRAGTSLLLDVIAIA